MPIATPASTRLLPSCTLRHQEDRGQAEQGPGEGRSGHAEADHERASHRERDDHAKRRSGRHPEEVLVTEYVLTAPPSHRAAPVAAPQDSTLDSTGKGMLLPAGPEAMPDVSTLADVPITTRVIDDKEFLDIYRVDPAGAVLVRPGEHADWRRFGTAACAAVMTGGSRASRRAGSSRSCWRQSRCRI
ncbi:hypothetical protein [Lentzea guizhouensis]|uniref:hypothetical protein n=1 Tax=Lentzea guizhouensis TaxID=1586287 RepID=UPI0012B6A0E1|nr:hypothetical protein [Lentzea guizhouensis]